MTRELLLHPLESPRQILLVAVEVRAEPTSPFLQSPIDGIVHALVLLDDQPKPFLCGTPLLHLRSPARILNDVLQRYAFLVSDRSCTEFEPVQLPKTRSDDGEHDSRIRYLERVGECAWLKGSAPLPVGINDPANLAGSRGGYLLNLLKIDRRIGAKGQQEARCELL